MAAVATLKALLGLDTGQWKAGMREAGLSVDSFGSKLSSIGRTLGVAFSGAAIVAMGRSLVKWASDISQAAQNAGILTEEMMGLNQVAKQNGLEVSDMQRVLAKVQNQLYEAAGGSKEAKKGFDGIGLSIGDLAGLDPVSLLRKIAQAAIDTGTPLEAISAIVGERLGPNFVSALKQIAEDGLPAVSKAAGDAADAVERLGDEFDALKESLGAGVLSGIVGIVKAVQRAGTFYGAASATGSRNPLTQLKAGFAAMDEADLAEQKERNAKRVARARNQKSRGDELVKRANATEASNAAAAAHKANASEVESYFAGMMTEQKQAKAEDAAAKARAGVESDYAEKLAELESSRGGERGISAIQIQRDSMARMGGMVGNSRSDLTVNERQFKLAAEAVEIAKKKLELDRERNEKLKNIEESLEDRR